MQPVQEAALDAMLDHARTETEVLQLIPGDQRILLRRHDADAPIDMIERHPNPTVPVACQCFMACMKQ